VEEQGTDKNRIQDPSLINWKAIAGITALLIIALSAGWLVVRYYIPADQRGGNPLIELSGVPNQSNNISANGQPVEGAVSVKIFYPSAEGIMIVEKNIKAGSPPAAMAESIVAEYLKSLYIKDVKLLGVYRDRKNVFYIDLSDDFKKGFSGDIRHEYRLLKSLYDTVASNVPGVEDVRILIEGKEIESIGGHFYSLYGLKGIMN
jgi:hypothetical protein